MKIYKQFNMTLTYKIDIKVPLFFLNLFNFIVKYYKNIII